MRNNEFQDSDLFRVVKKGDVLRGDPRGVLTRKGADTLNDHKRKVIEGKKVPAEDLVRGSIHLDTDMPQHERRRLLKILNGRK